ncbi:unnamed protein product [Calypogeia fissa]
MVSSAAHILGHAASHAARLKEEVYAVHHSGDLFYPFVVELFGALHPVLDRFLRSTAAVPPVSVVTAFLRQRVSIALQRAQAFTIQRRRSDLGRLGMFLSLIRRWPSRLICRVGLWTLHFRVE